MRETKFRGKSDLSIEELEEAGVPHKNGWIVGNLIGNEKLPVIVGPIVDCNDEYFNTEWWASVVPETVGQYTGQKDQSDVEIYEGDIVEIQVNDRLDWNIIVGKVIFLEGTWLAEDVGNFAINLWSELNEIKVISNIHDNPELWEVAK